MRVTWKNLVITDYEQSFSAESTYVHWLYGRSHIAAPHVLLGWPGPLGAERRPGVIDTPAWLYDRFMVELKAALMSTSGVDALTGRYVNCRNALTNQLRRNLDRRRVTAVKTLESKLIRLMAFHVLNWAMPSDEAIELLTQIFGDELAAQTCLLALCNDGASHLLRGTGSDEAVEARRRASNDCRMEAVATALMSAQVRGVPAQVVDSVRTIQLAWRLAMREEEERKTLQAEALRVLEPYERESRWL